MLLLAGDVGGTKTSLAIYSPEAGPRSPLAQETLSSARYSSLGALVSDFLAKVNLRPARASFGVAGPVVDGKATITNLPWIISERQLQVDLNLAPGSVSLLNDLVAIAHAVPWLEADDRVDYVTYAGLPSSPYQDRVKAQYPRGAGALFTFAVKGGYDACIKLVNALEIFSHVANLGDARSLIIHSASTTHRQLTPEQQEAAGAGPGVVRVSIGIEDVNDLIADLDQALAKATA